MKKSFVCLNEVMILLGSFLSGRYKILKCIKNKRKSIKNKIMKTHVTTSPLDQIITC